jgi:hypothetical protein
MRPLPLAIAALALLSAPALAQEWTSQDLSGITVEYFDNGNAQLQFGCRDNGDFLMGFVVYNIHADLAEATSTGIVLSPDPTRKADGSTIAGSYRIDDVPLDHNDVGASVMIGGPIAIKWAKLAQRASHTIQLSFAAADSGGGYSAYNTNDFSAVGSSAAISRLLKIC